MKLEKFVEKLQKAYGGNLQSVVLFGSAAAGDYQKGISDYNVMVVLKDIAPDHLTKGSKLIRHWMSRGNPTPLLIDSGHIESSVDVFPIEFSDMKEAHRILYGDNPIANIAIDREHLRLQCEGEVKQKILTLRERYVQLYPCKRRIRKMMIHSLSSFFAIFRAYLRLVGSGVPSKKREMLKVLNEKTEFDTSIFDRILETREGRSKIARSEVLESFSRYLTTLEKMASLIDAL